MIPTLRQELQAHIERLNALPRMPQGDLAYYLYFGNFNLILPGGCLRAEGGNKKWAQIVATEKPKVGSDLIKTQTYGEFYQTIDSVLEEEGISIEEVKRLNTKPSRELFELTSPAYVRLREIGYSEYDITS